MFDIERMYWIDTDTHPQYFITCSINKDDQLDIISANSKSNSSSVIMGYGNGTFKEQMIYSKVEMVHILMLSLHVILNMTFGWI